MVNNLPAMQETRFNPWVRKIPWRREWQPATVFLPGDSHRQRSLVGYSLWGCKELDTTEQLTLRLLLWKLKEQHRRKHLSKPLQDEFAKAPFLYDATGQVKWFQQKPKILKKAAISLTLQTRVEHFVFLQAIKSLPKKVAPKTLFHVWRELLLSH